MLSGCPERASKRIMAKCKAFVKMLLVKGINGA